MRLSWGSPILQGPRGGHCEAFGGLIHIGNRVYMRAYMKPNWDPEYETFRLYVDACTEPSGGSLHSRFRVNVGACENPTGAILIMLSGSS